METIPSLRPLNQRGREPKVEISAATLDDRELIYRARSEVYGHELGQHSVPADGRLSDALDAHNHYIVVKDDGQLTGFVSITPASAPSLSIDKYFSRQELPFPVSQTTYEVRLLTVLEAKRRSDLVALLMVGALRWVEAHGGTEIVGIGRQEVMRLYQRSGFQATGQTVQSGQVVYELMHASTRELRARTKQRPGLRDRIEEATDWQLPFDFAPPATCFHGGAFFRAIGEQFGDLNRRHNIINADVLDAWFPPAPAVRKALEGHFDWAIRTSPPTDCRGLVAAIAEVRGVDPTNILPGAGSSDLIFRSLPAWLTRNSRVLILDPTYGEYAHVLEKVIGCTVDRLKLDQEEGFRPCRVRLARALHHGYDMIILVNPNSPTGQHIDHDELAELLSRAPTSTRIWIDETYIDYAGSNQSMEGLAARSENLIVCKSMSKVYALSGARVAYLCAGAHQLEKLRALTPPWVVGLPSQIAAVRALAEPEYYAGRYRQTAVFRQELAEGLRQLGWKVLPGIANFLLCELPLSGSTAARLVEVCRERGLFLRDASPMGRQLGSHLLRIAVKDRETNARMQAILAKVYQSKEC